MSMPDRTATRIVKWLGLGALVGAALLVCAFCSSGCSAMPVTQAALNEKLASLQASVDARVAEGEDFENAFAEEWARVKDEGQAALLDAAAQDAGNAIDLGDGEVSEKEGVLGLGLAWLLRNLPYALSMLKGGSGKGALISLLLGRFTKGAQPTARPEAK